MNRADDRLPVDTARLVRGPWRVARAGVLLAGAALLMAACGGGAGGAGGAPDKARQEDGQARQEANQASAGERPGKAARPPEPPAPPPLPGAVAVMIDNHPDARPQSGLDRADMVYEAIAEGGITRFLAIFDSRPAEKIGPVRSARPYFVEIASGHGVPYGHVGGSKDAYDLIARLGVASLDEIRGAGEAYWRSRERRAPHNVYTGTDRLLAAASIRGQPLRPLRPLPVGDAGGGDPAGEMRITYSNNRLYRYTTAYRWTGRRYEKLVNGEPLRIDGGGVVAADNVIVILARQRSTGDAAGHMEVTVTGRGDALFLTGGRFYKGRWRKDGPDRPFVFTRGDEPMRFAAGTTWINIARAGDVAVEPAGQATR